MSGSTCCHPQQSARAAGSPLERWRALPHCHPFHPIVTLAGPALGDQTDEALEGQPSMHSWLGPLATRPRSCQTWQDGAASCVRRLQRTAALPRLAQLVSRQPLQSGFRLILREAAKQLSEGRGAVAVEAILSHVNEPVVHV